MHERIDYTLYLVTDRELARERPLEDVVMQAVQGGVTIVQLREKNLSTREFLRQAFRLKELTDRLDVPLIINDRVDIAIACGAAGVHVGQDDMDCVLTRRIAGMGMCIGVSVCTVEEALRAERDGADYLGISPVFPTPTKTDTPDPAGIEGLRRIRSRVRIPLVGIGGISVANADRVVACGADGIAVVSAIMTSPDPCWAARDLREAIERGRSTSIPTKKWTKATS